MIRVFRAEDYEKLAKHVVNDFIDNETPLGEGVLKVAAEMDLSPEHIRNLVQLSNKMAHLRLFEKKADDKIVEFEPADPKAVLRMAFEKMSTENEKTAEDLGYDHASDFHGDFADLTKETVKEAAEESAPVLDEKLEHPHKADLSLLALRKVAEDLDSRRLQAEFGYLEELDKLAAEFAKLYGPDYVLFEKDALATYGEITVPTLNDIRDRLRMDPLNGEIQKTAHLVDTDTEEMSSLQKLLKFASEAAQCGRGHEFLKEKLGDKL